MLDDISNNLIENKRNISFIHILLITILLTVDFYSVFTYGIEFKSVKYLINYQELVIINTTIIGIGILLFVMSRKRPISFFIGLFLLFSILLFDLNEKKFADYLFEMFIITTVIFIILFGNSAKYKETAEYFDGINKWIMPIINIFIIIIIVNLLSSHYQNLNNNWDKIVKKHNEYYFNEYKLSQILFKQKIFSTNRLEELQTNINFKNSELYVNKLIEYGILKDDILYYNNKELLIKYIRNGNYKTFFIIKKDRFSGDTIKMYIVFSEKNQNREEYQIINVQEKDLMIEEE
ncbi:hypothetical protein PJV95_08635 [Aliarcobacter butzleri]|uniref:hypothetical protein n=1 Tax=Aliarcobacter butzleri TaxID=28197 RepID=UPI00263D1A38|nr:hypothetical protein [Aliarcobacter butzleri]MDN5126304.1 hypothetical protein [Aliarcobacter butzleri]